MKKALLLIMMLSIIGMARVITYTETFDNVKTIWPAKSKTHECKTRVNLDEGLIDNQACAFEYIIVYDKDGFNIGSLPGMSAYEDSRYSDYDNNRYIGKGKRIYVDYIYDVADATEEYSSSVSCPKGMVKYIDDVFYRCKKPYSCDADMYAIDEIECSSLPDNAHRNTKDGFSCNKGYIMNADGYCEEKVICGKNEVYDKEYNTCHSRPENSHFLKNSFDWECNTGYVKQGFACEEIVKCDTATRYNVDNNTCIELPDFAEWVDSISSEWTCNSGYIIFGNGCVEKAICSQEQRYDENLNSCIDPYPNSRWTGVDDYYVCVSGYVKNYETGNCEEKPDCDHYNAATNSCYEKPTNSHWAYNTGAEWECDDGFHEGYNECIKCSGDAQYDPSSRECVEKPNNSHWIFDGRWMCDDGFVEMNGYCEEIASCGFFEEYNSYNNTCISKPLNLTDHVRDFMEYVHFTHDMGMDVGVGSFKDNYDESQVLINIGMDYNIGISIGSDNVKVRLQGSVAFLYTLLDYSTSEYAYTNEEIMALMGLYGFNVGLDLWRITLAYSYLFVAQSELDNISFNNALHKIRAGFMLNEHWDAHLAVIPNLIKFTSIMKTYNNTWYHIGMTYRF